MRNAMEKELKTERARGNGKDFALTLMPLYAVGVGVFALYKFLKVMSIILLLNTNCLFTLKVPLDYLCTAGVCSVICIL